MSSRELDSNDSPFLVDVSSLKKEDLGKPIRKTWQDWVSARLTGPCGDTMELNLQIRDSLVVESRHRGNGCLHSRACLSIVAESAKGRAVDDLPELSPDYILEHITDLPEDSRHCAQLAYDTLMQTVDEYFNPVHKNSRDSN